MADHMIADTSAVQRLRNLVHDCLSKHMYEGAAFFADKLTALSDNPMADMYLMAQAFFMNREYRRCIGLLRGAGMVERDVRCRYLAARCLAAVREWDACLQLLGAGDEGDEEGFGGMASDAMDASQDGAGGSASESAVGAELSDASAICLLRGRVYQALDNQGAALRCYRAALAADPYCYEAFQALVGQHLLSDSEELALVDGMGLRQEDGWLRLLYRSRCKKYAQQGTMESQLAQLEASGQQVASVPTSAQQQQQASEASRSGQAAECNGAPTCSDAAMILSPRSVRVMTRSMTRTGGGGGSTPVAAMATTTSSGGLATSDHQQQMEPAAGGSMPLEAAPVRGWGMGGSVDVMACRAEWCWHQGRYQESYDLTASILDRDPYATDHMPRHLAAAVELGKRNELFLKAHRLVEEHPDRAVSWFAVACYYMVTQQYDSARRYFGRATALDRMFAPAWLGFGHAFAAQDESDQAMAAYRSAARLFPGLHAPLVGMGMEYGRMNNTQLAEQLLQQAHRACPTDPLVCNELGVLAYRGGRYQDAISWLSRVLEQVPEGGQPPAAWEATMVNLGHAYRKSRQYGLATKWYSRALGLSPAQAGTYAALGYTHHLQGDLLAAIEHYHRALALRPDDAFTAEMLTAAITDDSVNQLDNIGLG